MHPESLASFGREIEAIGQAAYARLGERDVQRLERLDRISQRMELCGRLLIHFSLEPVSFATGVTLLWAHKQLQAIEIGHSVLHGAYDKLNVSPRYRSTNFRWDAPIDEASWRNAHNVRHHGHTNIAGRDQDIHFGPVRCNAHTPHQPIHNAQGQSAYVLLGIFAAAINLQYSGLGDVLLGNGRPEQFDVIKERSPKAIARAFYRAFRKYAPYYGKEFLFYPALAGPFFWKVALGNLTAELMRDVYTGATIYCGHIGEDVVDYPAGTRPGGRHRWYVMQIEASSNYEVPHVLSVLCGGLDLHIEHHLFPKLPPERLREIAPQVRAVCEKYGVQYKTDSWPAQFRKAFRRIAQLALPDSENTRSLGLKPMEIDPCATSGTAL